MANPVFSRNKEFSGQSTGFNVQGADSTISVNGGAPTISGAMSYEGTIVRASVYFALALATALVVGSFAQGLTWPLSIVGLALSLVVAFSRNPSPILMGVTVAAYGGVAGGLTGILESIPKYQGIALQAVLATAAVFVSVLALYRSGKIRTSPKMTRFFYVALTGYVLFSIVNAGMIWLGHMDGFGIRSMDIGSTGIPWGVPIGIFAILLGTYMLLSDFEFIANGVRRGAPARLEWVGAYGLVFSLIWLYIEFLRLLAILRR